MGTMVKNRFKTKDNNGLRRVKRNISVKIKKQLFADVRKEGVFKNFAIFKGKHLYWSLFFIKLQA